MTADPADLRSRAEQCRHKFHADVVRPPLMETCEFCDERREIANPKSYGDLLAEVEALTRQRDANDAEWQRAENELAMEGALKHAALDKVEALTLALREAEQRLAALRGAP